MIKAAGSALLSGIVTAVVPEPAGLKSLATLAAG
jgi:hypothetical protein